MHIGASKRAEERIARDVVVVVVYAVLSASAFRKKESPKLKEIDVRERERESQEALVKRTLSREDEKWGRGMLLKAGWEETDERHPTLPMLLFSRLKRRKKTRNKIRRRSLLPSLSQPDGSCGAILSPASKRAPLMASERDVIVGIRRGDVGHEEIGTGLMALGCPIAADSSSQHISSIHLRSFALKNDAVLLKVYTLF